MKSRPDIKILVRFLHQRQENRAELADYLGMKDPNSIYQWLTRGRLPASRRKWILGFMKRRLRDVVSE